MTAHHADTRFARLFAARCRSLDASLEDQVEAREREKEALDDVLKVTRSERVEVGEPCRGPYHRRYRGPHDVQLGHR